MLSLFEVIDEEQAEAMLDQHDRFGIIEADAEKNLTQRTKAMIRIDEATVGKSYRFWGVRNAQTFVVLGRDSEGMFRVRMVAGKITYAFPWEPVVEG